MTEITKKAMILAATTSVVAVSALAAREKAAYCDRNLHETFGKGELSSMQVLIERDGKTLYRYVDSDGSDASFSRETPMAVMSVTKVFTSTLVAMLMEEGKLSVYDNVKTFIPDFPFDDVSVLHLLTHTSGIAGGYQIEAREKLLPKLRRSFPVDTDFAYFSGGYDLLAEIVERLSGMDIKDYAEKRIFEPLAMDHSKLAPHQGQAGMTSTAEDLVLFGRHILEIRKTGKAGIVKPATVDFLFREHTNGRYDRTPAFFLKSQTRRFSRYFGDLNSEESLGHAGASGCFFQLDPKLDTVQIILTNAKTTKFRSVDENFVRINNLLVGQFVD